MGALEVLTVILLNVAQTFLRTKMEFVTCWERGFRFLGLFSCSVEVVVSSRTHNVYQKRAEAQV